MLVLISLPAVPTVCTMLLTAYEVLLATTWNYTYRNKEITCKHLLRSIFFK